MHHSIYNPAQELFSCSLDNYGVVGLFFPVRKFQSAFSSFVLIVIQFIFRPCMDMKLLSKAKSARQGMVRISGLFVCLSRVFSFDRTSMCCAKSVIALCQPLLHKSCIKEKTTLKVQLITDGDRQAEGQTGRWTHTNIKGSNCTQLQFGMCVYVCVVLPI